MTPDLFGRSHRIQDAFHDLLGSGAMGDVGRFGLEKLGVREHDPELIIQLVKQQTEMRIDSEILHAGARRAMRCPYAEWPEVAGCVAWEPLPLPAGRALASRHSESAKMRIDPPAVRMYSTFPAEIQL